MSVKHIESFAFKLDGDTVRITSVSGGKKKESAVPIAVFINTNMRGREIIAKWQARQGAVVSIDVARKRKG